MATRAEIKEKIRRLTYRISRRAKAPYKGEIVKIAENILDLGLIRRNNKLKAMHAEKKRLERQLTRFTIPKKRNVTKVSRRP